MDKEALIRKIEISEFEGIEIEHSIQVKSDDNITINNDTLPFGENYFTWRTMKREVTLSDSGINPSKCEIWEYKYGGLMSMRSGLVLVKGGYITGCNILLRMS